MKSLLQKRLGDKAKFQKSTVKAVGELLRLFVLETCQRSLARAKEASDRGEDIIVSPEHLAAVLPQILLDF